MKLDKLVGMAVFVLVACTPTDKNLQAIIDQADEVKIWKYEKGDTLIRRTSREKDVALFKELLNGKEDNSFAGNPYGELSVYTKGRKNLSAVILRDGIKFTIAGKNYSRRFTYQSGIYVGEVK